MYQMVVLAIANAPTFSVAVVRAPFALMRSGASPAHPRVLLSIASLASMIHSMSNEKKQQGEYRRITPVYTVRFFSTGTQGFNNSGREARSKSKGKIRFPQAR